MIIEKTLAKVSPLVPILFESKSDRSATVSKTPPSAKTPELERSALRGILVHKALELFWDRLEEDALFEKLFAKEQIDDSPLQEEIKTIARNFQNTSVYEKLCSGVQHLFEYQFDEQIDGERLTGSIDMIYKDAKSDGWVIVDFKSGKKRDNHDYDVQLDFYRRVMEHKQLQVIDTQLCWLG